MKYIVLVGYLAVFGVQVTATNKVCNKETIDLAWKKCDETYLVAGAKDAAALRRMCKNPECLIKCKKDAVGDCTMREELREHLDLYDAERWKVYYRFTCSNLELAMQKFTGGCVANHISICSNESKGHLNFAEKDKQVLCSSLKNLRKCFSTSPGGPCTAAGAKFQEDTRKLRYSLSICDNEDIKYLYTKYGGPNKCKNSSGVSRISLQATSFVILYWVLHQFRTM